MSDLNEPTELELLKKRAAQMGIKHHPSIGVDKLKDKVNSVLKWQDVEGVIADHAQTVEQKTVELLTKPAETPAQREAREKRVREGMQRKKATKLIRVRIACMNPNKKEWRGEIFTVSNRIVGSLKKYVPFNNDEGWHIPYMMYTMLKEKECQIFTSVTGPQGTKLRKGKLIKEFAIEVLPPLTKKELKDLAQQQAMAGSIDR